MHKSLYDLCSFWPTLSCQPGVHAILKKIPVPPVFKNKNECDVINIRVPVRRKTDVCWTRKIFGSINDVVEVEYIVDRYLPLPERRLWNAITFLSDDGCKHHPEDRPVVVDTILSLCAPDGIR